MLLLPREITSQSLTTSSAVGNQDSIECLVSSYKQKRKGLTAPVTFIAGSCLRVRDLHHGALAARTRRRDGHLPEQRWLVAVRRKAGPPRLRSGDARDDKRWG
jgi:hypothetical protein